MAGDYAAINVVDETIVTRRGGELPVVARTTVRYGLRGFMGVGVPGSIGGAVRMNAGGHGADMKDALLDADVVNLAAGERRIVPAEELQLSYRHSALRTDELVVGCRLSLSPGDERRGKAGWPRSSSGYATTSPAVRTQVRCSPTPTATAPDD